VDGATTTKRHSAREGETITVTLPEPVPTGLVAQEIPLDIRYEDADVLVLSKPAGLVVHPSAGHADGTLVNALLAHCGDSLGSAGGAMRPGLVHRLDKDTSGLMMVAKNDVAQAALAADLKARRVDRRYLVLVHGLVEPDSGIIDAPIGRRPSDRMKMAVTDTAGSREAVTSFRVLERFSPTATDDGFTLLECKLGSGRTHQVRVHMAFAGHQVAGDPIYGRTGATGTLGLGRQFLHAWRLSFTHPVTGDRLEFSDSPPADLRAVLDTLAPRSHGRTRTGHELLNGPEA
jgi:23S rRNA pseudouridine1911/1915/1917 synthase